MHRIHVSKFAYRLADGSVCEFRADHLGFYALERLSGLGLFDYFGLPDKRLTRFYELAYAFSASWREDMGLDQPFRKFLQQLPVEHFQDLRAKLFELAFEALAAGAPRGNWLRPAALPPGGTGIVALLIGPFVSVVRRVSSGARALANMLRRLKRGTQSTTPTSAPSTLIDSQLSGEPDGPR